MLKNKFKRGSTFIALLKHSLHVYSNVQYNFTCYTWINKRAVKIKIVCYEGESNYYMLGLVMKSRNLCRIL